MQRIFQAISFVVLTSVSMAASATPILGFIIDGNTWTQGFSITNSSDGGEFVTRFQLDISTTNTCFDTVQNNVTNGNPCGFSGNGARAFGSLNGSNVTTGLVGFPVIADGTALLDLLFTDFNPGEIFSWAIDVDFNNGASTVFGNQLFGALATIDFSDGQRLLGVLSAVPGNADASQFVVTGITSTPSDIPAPSTLALLGLCVAGLAFRRKA